jgi:hypothetical protein
VKENVTMNYKVKISAGVPVVVDSLQHVVPGARVKRIAFPSESQTGPNGTEHYISGPGAAEIEVNGHSHSQVPLC